MAKFASDTEMFDTMRDKLYASVISDIVDSLGARYQGMRPDVRPIYQGAVVVGRAYPVLTADVYKFIDDPYGPEIDAVDALKPNDVMVVCTQRSTRTCFWGELLATAGLGDEDQVVAVRELIPRQILDAGEELDDMKARIRGVAALPGELGDRVDDDGGPQ